MKALPYPDNLHYDAAVGWLMLGDAASASEELARMAEVSRQQPLVLELAWSAKALLRDWTEAYALAQRLVSAAPGNSTGWVHRAYAARRMPGGGLVKAWEALHPAVERFPQEFLIPYNLACYAAQMERLDEAWDWLQRALQVAQKPREVREMALLDEDLRALRDRLRAEA